MFRCYKNSLCQFCSCFWVVTVLQEYSFLRSHTVSLECFQDSFTLAGPDFLFLYSMNLTTFESSALHFRILVSALQQISRKHILHINSNHKHQVLYLLSLVKLLLSAETFNFLPPILPACLHMPTLSLHCELSCPQGKTPK